jgi:DNA primase
MKLKIVDHFKGNYKSFFENYLTKIQKGGGAEYKAICPFHKDTNPSFAFNNETGKWYCHGCSKKGDVFNFYGNIKNLETRSDFGKILKGITHDFGIPWEKKRSKITRTYDYTDADGSLLYQVCRMEPKGFRQRRPDGNGKWIWNLKGIQRVLYRLPEVLKTDEVIIVEGEKDADNLSNLGLAATTSPMGAKKWRVEYNDTLAKISS